MKQVAILAVVTVYTFSVASAQTPARKSPVRKAPVPSSSTQPKFKAIWEPVNFNKDIELNSVAFTSAEEGWIVGAKNTIIHTKDGGKTWEVQLGGDPASTDRPLQEVFFLDDRHGWARGSAEQMLQTTDGATWQEVGKFSGHWIHPQFGQ